MDSKEQILDYHFQNGRLSERLYIKNGKRHRDEHKGPAYYRFNKNGWVETEVYWQNGICNRTNGPACIWYNADGSVFHEGYYKNGVEIRGRYINRY